MIITYPHTHPSLKIRPALAWPRNCYINQATQLVLQMHIIIDGSNDIFLGHMLGNELMYILLNGAGKLLGIAAELLQDLGQNRIIYLLMDVDLNLECGLMTLLCWHTALIETGL